MSQGNTVLPVAGPEDMSTWAGQANGALAALISSNSGNSAPSNGTGGTAVKGQFWLDTSTSPNAIKYYDGTTWAVVGYLDTTAHALLDPGPRASTGGTTIVITDHKRIIDIDSNASPTAQTLPALASVGAGFQLTFRKTDSSGNAITISDGSTPIGNIASVTSYVLSSQDQAVTLVSAAARWDIRSQYGASSLKKFVSADQTITGAGLLTLAHGLGAQPYALWAYLVMGGTTELGYTTGDIVLVNPGISGAANNQAMSIVPDTTNIVIRFGNGVPPFAIPHKTTGAMTNITTARWALRVIAWL